MLLGVAINGGEKADGTGYGRRLERRRADGRDKEGIGRRLRARRLECRLSQSELADKIGVTFQQVQKYEIGRNRMGASRLEQAAAALDVPISFFFDGAAAGAPKMTGKNAAASVFGLIQTSGAVRMVKAFHKIRSRKSRQILVEICEALARA